MKVFKEAPRRLPPDTITTCCGTMKTAVFAALIASATAFAPAKQSVQTSALAAYEAELGVQEPVRIYRRTPKILCSITSSYLFSTSLASTTRLVC